jgi:hypothetical protein
MVSNSVVTATDKIDHSHIKKMHEGKREHDLSGHCTNTSSKFRPGDDGLPGTDHQCCISKVEQVIPDEQDIVDGVGHFFITMKEAKYVNPAITVKPEAYMYCNKVSDEEVEDISKCIHIR